MSYPLQNGRSTHVDLDLTDSEQPTPANLIGCAAATLDVELDQQGKQHGHLCVPTIDGNQGLQQVRIPVCLIRGKQPGPTVLVIAGIHGDECEGTLAANRLARELHAEALAGCLIVIPAANPQALLAGVRCTPSDGLNMDLAMPGDQRGSITRSIAFEIYQRFILNSDVVIDLRSGGSSLRFIPSAISRVDFNHRSSPAARASDEELVIAYGAPNSVRMPLSTGVSCLQAAVTASGKTYLQAELGGGDCYDASHLSIAHTGCLNALRHLGMLSDAIELASTRLLEVRNDSFYVYAKHNGLYQPSAFLGEMVWKDEPMAHIVTSMDTDSVIHSVYPAHNSTLIAAHAGGWVQAGELIAVTADQVQA